MASSNEIARVLVKEGRRIFDRPPDLYNFTHNEEADRLLNDLNRYPHAFVIACIMDRQVKAERAWLIPYRLRQRLGDFEFATLRKLSLKDIREVMSRPEPLHRFGETMSKNILAAVSLIAERYSGRASAIWSHTPSSAQVVYRFLEFPGVGPKIATMAANILARHMKVPFADYYAIDISVDVHVRRVFSRMGLAERHDKNEALVYLARSLHPEFPGLLDFPVWEIGRRWCRPTAQLCSQCLVRGLCPSANA